jgi:hypothetical protein
MACALIMTALCAATLRAQEADIQVAAGDPPPRPVHIQESGSGAPKVPNKDFVEPQGPGCAAEVDPFAGEQFSSYGTLDAGFLVGFGAERGGKPVSDIAVYAGGSESAATTRVIMDDKQGVYAGYRLQVEPSPEGQPFRLWIKPIPDDYTVPSKMLERFCKSCPPWSPLKAKLARYPEPFEVSSGASFLVDLLVNPRTGEKLQDRVKILRVPAREHQSTRGYRMDVEFTSEGTGSTQVWTVHVCMRDMESGKLANGRPLRKTLESGSRPVTFLQGWQRSDGTNQFLKVDAGLGANGRMAFYKAEISAAEQGDERRVLLAEEVRFPIPRSTAAAGQ